MSTPGHRVHRGIGVSPGVATGPAARLGQPPRLPTTVPPVGENDRDRARTALAETAAELERRAKLAGPEAAEVLTAAAMMARDPALAGNVRDLVDAGVPAAWAVDRAIAGYRELLANAGPYMAERVADLDDIRDRAVAYLLGLPMPGLPAPGHPYVLVAEDLAPADTALLDPAVVLAVVTERGGPTSHTAILAKSLGIPAVVACPVACSFVDGQPLVVDGSNGTVVTDPTQSEVDDVAARRTARAARATQRGPGRTADGHPIALLANVGGPADAEAAAALDLEGVGLFRTEFLFLDRAEAPTIEEQRRVYRRVLEPLHGRKVVVRTLDAGADKPVPYACPDPEDNPALGVRGLRTAWRRPDLLRDQLEALALAAADAGATPWVMAPMVATAAEAADFATTARRHGIAKVGVMIEIPAAALRAAAILSEVDFVSLGTNDLAQYTFAADRQLGALAPLLDPWQPALLDLIAFTARAGQATAKPIGVCGEAASDPLLALVLTGLGIDSLSMAPVSVPDVRTALATHTIDDCREIAAAVLRADTAAEARATATHLAHTP
ncbi:phosphoenolpyruvate--protein phosphotransferase [Actinokineospora iranica]|uniref:Phosphoenolpyruvate-protein phosphotransferase n=1 Tax=Actinokineospora iranica TaxID=1271860 RepID=A0A1G6UVE1_9PSEU|nr:phosphoenolpyruvate--protein phosphotransferase [Actinokineospora iranica]SDD44525.1 phosphoenolpyruvate--protein phosphotransferase [Actinokineospora iranica]